MTEKFPTLETDVSILRLLQGQRQGAINMQNRINNNARAFVRRCLGFQTNMTEEDRKKIRERSEEICDAIESGAVGDQSDRLIATYTSYVQSAIISRGKFDEMRKTSEKQMVKIARNLPGYGFVGLTDGLGELGFAQLVGECGDLAKYDNPGKLWKRLGLAPVQGPDGEYRACSSFRKYARLYGELAKAEWEDAGYNPSRNALCYNIASAIVKTGKASQSHYRQIYDDRKAMEIEKALARGMTVCPAASMPHKDKKPDPAFMSAGQINFRAMRYMIKRLVRDLWRSWRKDLGLSYQDKWEATA